ncbi:MAG: coproporphyrinogen dehydrogenase HemZ [Oscillospiraceae bacterium]|nr:coproporphyrinogen dehydrogenase HemZ [Oscillospiraceae bacterium]
MTLIFKGNDFKYELEAVCKLFFPVKTFNFFFADIETVPDLNGEDYCYIARQKRRANTLLSVYAKIGGKRYALTEIVDNGINDYDDTCEFILGKIMYRVLSHITGITPKWGILTGVRPVKLVNKLMKTGMTRDEIQNLLKTKYLMSEEKINIAYATAKNQEDIMSGVDERSFSLYVSIPFCPTRCAYCSFVSQTVSSFKKLMPEYVKKLCQEIRYTASLVKDKGFTLDTVYFGGGTPTSIEAKDLDTIMKTIAECFDLSHLREYTVEAGRPDTITADKLKAIKQNGGTRVSINPQTMHDSVLEAIGRKHTVSEFLDSYSLAKSIGFDCVNVDLIAGLPTDTVNDFKETVESIIALQPENITIHALSIKRAADLMQDQRDVSSQVASDMIDYATTRLTEEGYLPYYLYRQKNQLGNQENIGWTKKGKASVYNITIMEEVQTIIAVGAGGSTKLVDLKNRELERFFNPKYPLEYLKHFEDMVIPRKEKAIALLGEMFNDKKE